jgi:hypothetical protein
MRKTVNTIISITFSLDPHVGIAQATDSNISLAMTENPTCFWETYRCRATEAIDSNASE